MSVERARLDADPAPWREWGPYLAERAWGTVREDYSADGDAWNYFPHDHARSRAYRWNEDGLLGLCDEQQRLCVALALWNGRDPILKERLFGLSGTEGNHGEDVKEYYYYLDATPTHSYQRALYKYPQGAFPYEPLVAAARARTRADPEYELLDTGIFDEDRYFDVFVEYAKAGPRDLLIRITAHNRGSEAAPLDLLPSAWFKNTWSWGGSAHRPRLSVAQAASGFSYLLAEHPSLGPYALMYEGEPELLFTENDTNTARLFGTPTATPYVKDAFHRRVVQGERGAVNPARQGSKAALWYHMVIPPGESASLRLRLTALESGAPNPGPFADFDAQLALRVAEADEFYRELQAPGLDDDQKMIQRQAYAGLLWSKQFYLYDVDRWLKGDPHQPAPPAQRRNGRNADWTHLHTADIFSMPDKWEYPWFAAWDVAFHCISLAQVDPEFAKAQLRLLGREWYQHPNGQIPAYEWDFGDVNPPVLAWGAWRVYTIDRKRSGKGDLDFLERAFHKLLLNFTWWVNRKDAEGHNVFQGGFLGLDNIGVFDRSAPLPLGGSIQQSDGTSWMGMFSIYMLTIALELAVTRPAYEDIATKFFEHFLYIAAAMNNLGGDGIPLWDEGDEFFYDVLSAPPDVQLPLKVRSLVGIIPLFAATTMEPDRLARVPNFRQHLEWFLRNRPDLARLVSRWTDSGMGERRLVGLLRGHRLKRILKRVLDPDEFLSEHGVRSLSRYHAAHPYELMIAGENHGVAYVPGESDSAIFGGNSNWRGPVWLPINYLIIESLLIYHHYYGHEFKVECPTGSGQYLTLKQVSMFLGERVARLWMKDGQGRRPALAAHGRFQSDPHWRDYLLFHEYFHGDSGLGLGASHQTGWTGLIAKMLQELAERRQG